MAYFFEILAGTMRRHRLEDARDRIRTACAERNYFSPVFQLVRYDFDEGRCPPDPSQVQQDLQTMFEKFFALESSTADAVYEDISLKVWEMANDEHLHFDWETFQETAGEG
jgi:coenzyme F420-reducing hydrogenase gamma subunit